MLNLFRSRAFALCFFANLAQMTSFYLFLHFPGHVTALGAGEQWIGWLVAATELASIAASPFVGKWLDAKGRRQVLVVGSVLNVALCAGFLVATSLLSVFPLRVLHGVIETALNVAFFTYAADLIPRERRSQGFAVFGLSAMGAVGVGAAAGDIAISIGGYHGIFLSSMALSLVGMLMVLRLEDKASHEGDNPDSASHGWIATLVRPNLLGVWLLSGALFFAMISVFVFLKTWVGVTGVGTIGWFFAVYAVTAIVLRIVAGGVPDRVGYVPVALMSLGVYAFGLGLLSLNAGWFVFFAAAFVCGVGHGFAYPVLLSLVTARARQGDQGSAISIFNMLDDGAALAAGPALGFIVETSGYALMFLSSAAVLGIGMAAGGLLLLKFDDSA